MDSIPLGSVPEPALSEPAAGLGVVPPYPAGAAPAVAFTPSGPDSAEAPLATHEHIHEETGPYCSALSKLTGNFVDLSHLARLKTATDKPGADWHIRGLDFPYNFTVNVCNPVLSTAVISGVPARENVSALYTDDNGVSYSLGQTARPFFRGRSLVLQYEDGSYCTDGAGKKTPFRMSSTFLFKCDRELPVHKDAVMTYISSVNNCSFMFEVKTPYACPSVNSSESMSPVTIFFIISLVALAVYCAGTLFYRPISLVKRLSNANSRYRPVSTKSREDSYPPDFS